MPAPPSSVLEGFATAALQDAGLRGQHIPELATVLGQVYGQALSLFLSQARALPGIPAAGNPVSQTGATSGPGSLMPPPAGGPDQGAIEPLALSALSSLSLDGEKKESLASVVALAMAQGIALFTSLRQVSPGIAVTGAVTTSPGVLMGAGPDASAIESLVGSAMQAQELQGEHGPDLAKALGQVVSQALELFATMALVAPGIACPIPGATSSPGMFM